MEKKEVAPEKFVSVMKRREVVGHVPCRMCVYSVLLGINSNFSSIFCYQNFPFLWYLQVYKVHSQSHFPVVDFIANISRFSAQ